MKWYYWNRFRFPFLRTFFSVFCIRVDSNYRSFFDFVGEIHSEIKETLIGIGECPFMRGNLVNKSAWLIWASTQVESLVALVVNVGVPKQKNKSTKPINNISKSKKKASCTYRNLNEWHVYMEDVVTPLEKSVIEARVR